MTTRKLSEKNIRKLTRVGTSTLSVTIPIDYVKELKWRERQKVVVKKQGKNLIIQDWKK